MGKPKIDLQVCSQKQEHLPTFLKEERSRIFDHNLSLEPHIPQITSLRELQKRPISLNHNFQKHAVVTIKKLMWIKYSYEATECQKLSHLMWNIFMSSGINSKKILVILFGIASLSDHIFINIINKCGFQEILKYGESLIIQSQEFLRTRLVESVTEQRVRENLQNCRSIKQSHQFLIYFRELLQSIKEAPLRNLRISNQTAKKIEATIRAQRNHI